ncbi:glycosyltransferase family 39 protein [Candidatus Woesearchaeota archaeon]|nr:glycosyltransferase family 39 protein [Candidatus Woesearchaeota archaeon]
MNKNKAVYSFLTLILFGGFLLRMYHLDSQSIWFDEAFSIHLARQSVMEILMLKEYSPPLYYLIAHEWAALFGISEYAIRLLSVMFGVAGIYAMFLFGSLLYDKRIGIFAALFMAVSPLQVYYSQEARTYTLLLLLTLSSMYFYVQFYRERKLRNAILYLICSLLLLYSHAYAVFIVLVQNAHYMAMRYAYRLPMKRWAWMQGVMLALYIPWILALPGLVAMGLYTWIPKPTLFTLSYALYAFPAGEIFSILGLILVLVCLALAGILIRQSRKSGLHREMLLLAVWAIAPIFASFIFSVLVTPIFTVKYVMISSLPFYILISLPLLRMKMATRIIVVSSILLLSVLLVYNQANTISKDPWREISGYVRANEQGEPILVIDDYESLPFSYYYQPECFAERDVFGCLEAKGIYPVKEEKQIEALPHDFWLILSNKDNGYLNKERLRQRAKAYFEVLAFREFSLKPRYTFFNRIHSSLAQKGLIQEKFDVIEAYHLRSAEERRDLP